MPISDLSFIKDDMNLQFSKLDKKYGSMFSVRLEFINILDNYYGIEMSCVSKIIELFKVFFRTLKRVVFLNGKVSLPIF